LGCFSNNISVKFNNKKYNRLPLPLVTGTVASLGLISSPFLLLNYFGNFTYFDKLFDKYDIKVERYHQYDGNNNKYAFPSMINITIDNKETK
jgi:hypothetical protein